MESHDERREVSKKYEPINIQINKVESRVYDIETLNEDISSRKKNWRRIILVVLAFCLGAATLFGIFYIFYGESAFTKKNQTEESVPETEVSESLKLAYIADSTNAVKLAISFFHAIDGEDINALDTLVSEDIDFYPNFVFTSKSSLIKQIEAYWKRSYSESNKVDLNSIKYSRTLIDSVFNDFIELEIDYTYTSAKKIKSHKDFKAKLVFDQFGKLVTYTTIGI